MKVRLCVIVGGLMLCRAALGQVTLTPDRAPYLTSDQIIVEATAESAAASVVAQALVEWVRIFPKTSTTLIASQLPEHWLPAIPGVQFVRLSNDAARVHLQKCGKLLFVQSFKSTPSGQAALAMAEGTRCTMHGLAMQFRRSQDGWHLVTGGLHGGFASTKGHCGCR
jgi:hypothetical protein